MAEADDIYLCQVSENLSCGACCGLYNVPDLSREKLEKLLAERTGDFASVPRTEDGIFAFQRKHKGPHRLSRPFAQFHHCPFLGLIGERNSRPGCLLHPAAPGNDGREYRSLSWYGEQACRNYFCPSTTELSGVYRSILLQTIDNWYDFGLLLTEHALLNAYFAEMTSRLGRPVTEADYAQNTGAREAFREFARLKSHWPFRRQDAPGPCNFFFANGLYPRPEVFRASPDIRQSPYDQLLRELDSGFQSPLEIEEADLLLDNLFTRTVAAIVR